MCCAASAAPDVFSKVVIVDSPMFNPLKRAVFALGCNLPDSIIDKVHPLVKGALAKKHEWGSMEEAEEYYRGRRLYQKFPEETIKAFLEHGLVEGADGKVGLRFPHLSEACMYKTTPFETPILGSKNGYMGQYDARSQDGVFLTSRKMDFLDGRDVEFLKETFGREGGGGFEFEEFEEGHFWPLIDPRGFAEVVARHV
ncbi:hypothetical protein TrRE_jg8097 [Triparma retinervis]|uniref:Uncharacterized protein n=1 Tax=Triparma retinervis TaxID=2557542 RepID=A0A9W7E540_9STRA|nr:hypothetical protein TrRE_jg8097 [Triparma retinervis]